jgi:hypothetical protein
VSAYDVQANYTVYNGRLGAIDAYLVGTYFARFERQVTPLTDRYDSVGFSDNGSPLRWKGNMGITWTHGALDLGWNLQYYHSYSILYADPDSAFLNTDAALNQGAKTVRHQIYNDLSMSYGFGNEPGRLLRGARIQFGVQNVFNKRPPLIATPYGSGYSLYGDPRLRRFSLSVTKSIGR